jgi:hypothetical protein
MSNDLTPKDIVAWCRTQAKKFNDIADTVESTFHSNGIEAMRELELPAGTPDDDEKILNSVRAILREKAKRFGELAELTGARRKRLEKLLTPDRGFEVGPQGWITVKDKN